PVTQTDAAVECYRPDPQGDPASAEFLGIPEPDVVATVGAGADRLLEGEVLLPSEDEQVADGRIGVGAVKEHAVGDEETRLLVTGSAASQPNPIIAWTTSSSVPIRPTLSGSPGIPSAVRVVLGALSRAGWCSQCRQRAGRIT